MFVYDHGTVQRLSFFLMILDQASGMTSPKNLVTEASAASRAVGKDLFNVINHDYSSGYSRAHPQEGFDNVSFRIGTIEVPLFRQISPEHSENDEGEIKLGDGESEHINTNDFDRGHTHQLTQGNSVPQVEIAERDEGETEHAKNKGKMGLDNGESSGEPGVGQASGEIIDHIGDVTGEGERAEKSAILENDAWLQSKDVKDNKKKKRNRTRKKASKISDLPNAGAVNPGARKIIPVNKDGSMASAVGNEDEMLKSPEEDEGGLTISTLESGQTESEYDMMNAAYVEKILYAFEPNFESELKLRPNEIFPTVYKPRWGITLPTDISLLEKPFHDFLLRVREGDDPQELEPEAISKAAHRIIELHLKTSEPVNHQPLERLNHETYKSLQFLWNLDRKAFLQVYKRLSSQMNKYEAYRRLLALVFQITQKTSVENWKLIKGILPNSLNRMALDQHLEKLGKYLRLNEEFPDEILAGDLDALQEYQNSHPNAFKVLGAHNVEELARFVFQWMGTMEFTRRFEFIQLKQQIAPSAVLAEVINDNHIKSLRIAKESNGLDFWTVIHMIQALGLGKENSIKNSVIDMPYQARISLLVEVIISPIQHDSGLPWFESPERQWLVEQYGKEYRNSFNKLCLQLREIAWEKKDPHPPPKTPPFTRYSKIVHDCREIPDILLAADHGLDFNIMRPLQSQIDLKTPIDPTNWEIIFGYFPIKLTADQKQFLKDWLEETTPGT